MLTTMAGRLTHKGADSGHRRGGTMIFVACALKSYASSAQTRDPMPYNTVNLL